MTSEISSPGAVPAEVRLLAWTILYGGEPTGLYMTLAGAEAELARRNTEYPNSAEHRRLVALAAAPSHPPASVRMLTPDDARQLLCVRDYLEAGKIDDAVYALTAFADHEMTMVSPWKWVEELAGKTIPAANEGEKK